MNKNLFIKKFKYFLFHEFKTISFLWNNFKIQ